MSSSFVEVILARNLRSLRARVSLAALALLCALPAHAGNFCAIDSNRGHGWNAQTESFTPTSSTISGLTQVLGSGGSCAAIGSSHVWVWDGQTASWSDSGA